MKWLHRKRWQVVRGGSLLFGHSGLPCTLYMLLLLQSPALLAKLSSCYTWEKVGLLQLLLLVTAREMSVS